VGGEVRHMRSGGAEWRRALVRPTRPAPRAWTWIAAALVAALFCVPLFVGLGAADLDNDEAIYAFAVDVMLRSGDWLTPRSAPNESVPFLEKPPLKLWIVAAAIRMGLLPHDEFGLRFWDAVFSGLAFLYVFAIGRRLGGPLAGFGAVALLFAHYPLLFAHGLRTNNMEAAVFLCHCAGVHHYLAWRVSERRGARWLHATAVALAFVLGFMTKFVAALFLPLVLGVAAFLSRPDRARLRRDWTPWAAAGLLAAGLIAPWFVCQFRQFGADVWRIMFDAHVMTRFTTFLDPAHVRPWHYYADQLIRQLRWSGSLGVALVGLVLLAAVAVRHRRGDALVVLTWFVVPVALISVLSSKLYHYVYPFLPALALGGGLAVAVAARLAWSLPAACWPARDPVAGPASPGAAPAPAGRLLRSVQAGLALLVVLALLPVGAWRRNFSFLGHEPHPLRSMRDCLAAVNARDGRPGASGPGVWAEAESLSHVYHYYLHGLGPWQMRDFPSDPTVYVHLYAPGSYRPVLLSRERFEAFIGLAQAGDHVLIERAARKAGLDPAVLAAAARQTPVAQVRFPAEVLMLPGPFSACAAPL